MRFLPTRAAANRPGIQKIEARVESRMTTCCIPSEAVVLVPEFRIVIATVTGLVDAFTVTVGGWKLHVLPVGRFAQLIWIVPE